MVLANYGMSDHAKLNLHAKAKLILKLGLSNNISLFVLLLSSAEGRIA